MLRKENLARLLLAVGLLIGLALPFAGRWLQSSFSPRTIELHARMPEDGGWKPDVLRATAGLPLRLRLISDDVVHGFAVGQMHLPPIDLLPGEVKEISLTFDHPGTYTFYCTRWCGPNHWRMRGVIEVSGPGQTPISGPSLPLWVRLGLDLDAPHPAAVLPEIKPAAKRGMDLLAELEEDGLTFNQDYYRSHAPAKVWQELRANPFLKDRSDAQLWDMVAAIWQQNTDSQSLAEGQKLYAANCAACHGQQGAGDGVFAQKPPPDKTANQGMPAGRDHQLKAPADFTDSASMLGASPALLQGKILRGGMGTGMPMWGTIFTQKQTWDLVAYLFSFQFELDMPEAAH